MPDARSAAEWAILLAAFANGLFYNLKTQLSLIRLQAEVIANCVDGIEMGMGCPIMPAPKHGPRIHHDYRPELERDHEHHTEDGNFIS